MTGLHVPVGFGGEVRLGIVKVPDERIDAMSKIFKPKKTTYAEISFCDVPGEHGAEKKGLSTKSLQQIRDQEALCLVLRDFDNPAVEGKPDPLGDLEAFHTECVFADLELVERRLARAAKEKAPPQEVATFELDEGRARRRPSAPVGSGEGPRSQPAQELRLPHRPAVARGGESRRVAGVASRCRSRWRTHRRACRPADWRCRRAWRRRSPASRLTSRRRSSTTSVVTESALTRFIRAAYGLLDLISFFTVGEDEVRAWTIRRGTAARQAAGRIHSDLERGFITGRSHSVRGVHQARVGTRGEGSRQAAGGGEGVHRLRRRHHACPVQRLSHVNTCSRGAAEPRRQLLFVDNASASVIPSPRSPRLRVRRSCLCRHVSCLSMPTRFSRRWRDWSIPKAQGRRRS